MFLTPISFLGGGSGAPPAGDTLGDAAAALFASGEAGFWLDTRNVEDSQSVRDLGSSANIGAELLREETNFTNPSWVKSNSTIENDLTIVTSARFGHIRKNFTSATPPTSFKLTIDYEIIEGAEPWSAYIRSVPQDTSEEFGGENVLTSTTRTTQVIWLRKAAGGTSPQVYIDQRNTPAGTSKIRVYSIVVEETSAHFSQYTAAAQPTYNATEKAISFDGGDMISGLVGGTLTNNMTVFLVTNGATASDAVLLGGATLGQRLYYHFSQTDLVSGDLAGAPSIYINGVNMFNLTRVELRDALRDNGRVVIRVDGLDMTDPDFGSTMYLGARNNITQGYQDTIGCPLATSNTDAAALKAYEDALIAEYSITTGATAWGTDIDAFVQAEMFSPTLTNVWANTALPTTTMWQDVAGQTPADADNNPVALIADMSNLGPELVTNGTFDTDTSGWSGEGNTTVTWEAGEARVQTTATTSQTGFVQAITVDTSKTYKLEITGRSDGVWQRDLIVNGGVDKITTDGAVSTRSYIITPTNTTLSIVLSSGAATAGNRWYDNITLREITSAPLTQATASAQPTVDAASGLLDFDGGDYFNVSLPNRGTDAYFATVVNTTDTQFLLGSADVVTDRYFGIATEGSGSPPDINAGTPVYFGNGATAGSTRGDLYTSWAMGADVLAEASAVDITGAEYENSLVFKYGSSTSFNFTGLGGDVLICGEDPGVLRRNWFRYLIGQRHAITEFGWNEAYAVNGFNPAVVADFAGVNSGTEYYGDAAANATFDDMFTFARASDATYVDSNGTLQTATSGVARRNAHVWNGSAWENKGILFESEARTNLFLNSATLSTQGVTTTAQAYTVSFTGTGTITFSGAHTGSLVGTGTGEENRVTATFTPTAGTVTCTVSGTVSNAQFEAGNLVSSYIPTTGATATRAAETLSIAAANMAYSATGMSVAIGADISHPGAGVGFGTTTLLRWAVDNQNLYRVNIRDTLRRAQVIQEKADVFSERYGDVNSLPEYGVNMDVRLASRHQPDVVNLATSGTAASEITSTDTWPDLSSADFLVGNSQTMGYISILRIWADDIGDTGIAEATS